MLLILHIYILNYIQFFSRNSIIIKKKIIQNYHTCIQEFFNNNNALEQFSLLKNDGRKANKHHSSCRHWTNAFDILHKTSGHITNVHHLWSKDASKEWKPEKHSFTQWQFFIRLIWWACNAQNRILPLYCPENFHF